MKSLKAILQEEGLIKTSKSEVRTVQRKHSPEVDVKIVENHGEYTISAKGKVWHLQGEKGQLALVEDDTWIANYKNLDEALQAFVGYLPPG